MRFASLAAALLMTMSALPASAQQPAGRPAMPSADYARLPVCALAADGRSLAVEPCRTAPAQRPMPRRPVPARDEQRIGIAETRPPAPDATLTLPSATLPSATLNAPYPAAPRPPVPPAVNPAPSLAPAPTRPSPSSCVGDACRDAGGNQYRGGAVLTSPAGRPCTNTGGFIRCM
jgi:hypothetical protein